MYRKNRTALLALALSCAAAITTPQLATAEEEPVPACLDIVAAAHALQQDEQGQWLLKLEQKLKSPSCPGGADYSLHMYQGTSDPTTHSAPAGLGGDLLTFTVPVAVYDIKCTKVTRIEGQPLLSTEVDRKAVKGFGTAARGAHVDRAPDEGAFVFHNNVDPDVTCSTGGSASWS